MNPEQQALLDESLHVLEIPVRVINTLENYYRCNGEFWYVRLHGKELTTISGIIDGSDEASRAVEQFDDEDRARAEYTSRVRAYIEDGFRNILAVKDLLSMSNAELLQVPNFGQKTLDCIYDKLAEKGFYREGHRPERTHAEIVAERRRRLRREALGF